MSNNLQPIHGNHACALAAIAAGCRFFAGYPITPSSEIAEHMSRELPRVDGAFVQMEDEIGSLAAVIGASMGGAKAMTATSGPGFSLMQEHLGYAAMTEIPCVIINVMRGGPSTGMPTRPGQGDFMQARWGTHGDHPVIALAPASVQEIYSETVRAFNLSEAYRVPVVVLYDQLIAHLLETIEIPAPDSLQIAHRKWATGNEKDFRPYAETDDLIPLMARPGDGHRVHATGLTHTPAGFPTQKPEIAERAVARLLHKIERHRADIERYEAVDTDNADIVIVAVGIVARAARRAISRLRASGLRVGLFRPITLWPFPEQKLREIGRRARRLVVAELNAGQLALEVERLVGDAGKVVGINRFDGEPITPDQIVARVKELAGHE
jgi:2-oxoglutarate/2-oxoacid ferredoxin oxidoreductase subunit alpha